MDLQSKEVMKLKQMKVYYMKFKYRFTNIKVEVCVKKNAYFIELK